MNQKHPDGTPCLEGVRGAPKTFRSCCDLFEGHLSACVYDIRFEWQGRSGRWAIPIADAAGGGRLPFDIARIVGCGCGRRHLRNAGGSRRA